MTAMIKEKPRTWQEIIADTYRAVEVWTAVGLIYLLILTVMSYGLRMIEKRLPIL